MQLIAAAEGERRGLYGGAVGYLGYDGNLDTAITIRSAVLKDGQAHVHTGAGIVAGSVPETRVRGDRAQGRRPAPGDRAWPPGSRRGRRTPAASEPTSPSRQAGRAGMILVIDNYDSFTFNLVQALQAAGADVRVVRNDAIDRRRRSRRWPTTAERDLRGHRHLARAGRPGRCRRLGRDDRGRRRARDPAARRLPRACSRWRRPSARRSSAPRPSSTARRRRSPTTAPGLLEGMPPPFMAARYHSLASIRRRLPPELRVTAMSEVDRVVMGIRHVALPIEGVQFHPEIGAHARGPAPARQLPAPGRARGGGPARCGDAARSRRAGWRAAQSGRPMSEHRPAPALGHDRRGRHADPRRGARSRWARSWTARRRRPSSRRC